MQAFKENKTLFILFLVATITAIYGFYTPNKSNSENTLAEVNDTIIFFNYSAEQKANLINYFSALSQKSSFNGAILVGQKDSVFYEKSYGYADFSTRDSLKPQSSFQLASVSKQFTAIAILQLYEKGKLNLEDTIQRFFPEFPYKNITVHQLLVHRSGLPNYHYFLQHIPTTLDTTISNADIINEMIEKHPEAYYSPNRRYHYSNTGYAVLAAVVEKVSGMSYEEYVEKEIFIPLAMNNSFAYRGKHQGEIKNKTTGYLRRWRLAEDNYLDGVLGDKGIYCSAQDLFKWDQGLYKNIILNPDTAKLAFAPMGKPIHFKSNYGYGWRMFNWGSDTTKILFHAGWWHGYKSLLIRIPKDTTTIIVLKNRSNSSQVSTKSLLNIFYPENNQKLDSVKLDSTEQVG